MNTKGDKFILLNSNLSLINQDEPMKSGQLSNLFTFIFSNLNEFYDCRNNFVCQSFDLSYVTQSLIVNQFQNLKSEKELIQTIYFFEKVCFNQPLIQDSPRIMIKTIEQEIQNKNYENLILICEFLKRNNLRNVIEPKEEEEIKETDIDELLLNILTNDDFEYQDYLLEILFKLMMKDEDNLYCYLSYLVSKSNGPYEFRNYFVRFGDEYDDFCIIKRQSSL